MDQSLLSQFGSPLQRIDAALTALRSGQGILVVDDEDRENEGDLIFAAETMTVEQMALMIRACSGIVCLCLTDTRVHQLQLPMMVETNSSHFQTAFTVTIEAAVGVTTGVSAQDRLTTIRAAIADGLCLRIYIVPAMYFLCVPEKAACWNGGDIPKPQSI